MVPSIFTRISLGLLVVPASVTIAILVACLMSGARLVETRLAPDITLPKLEAPPALLSAAEGIVVDLNAAGEFSIGGRIVAPDRVVSELKTRGGRSSERTVFLRADAASSGKSIKEFLRLAALARVGPLEISGRGLDEK